MSIVYMTDPRIVRYYEEFDEHSRLTGAFGQLEFARTMDLLLRHLPPAPARILDIGGGTGPYSEALAKRGYEAHLLDPVTKHVEAARTRAGISSVVAGDARNLHWSAGFADVVLLLGPLYHLTERADRLQALREARRVLKPDGVLAAAAISRFASLLDGLSRGFIDDPRFQPILHRDLESGEHRNTTDTLDFFTTSYFHRPEELAEEIGGTGFDRVQIFAVEGPVWAAGEFQERWSDPVKRAFLLDVLRRVEREPSLLGASPHLLAIGQGKLRAS